MERMNLFTKLSVVALISSLPALCYSANNSDYFESLPEKTVLSIDKSYMDYAKIIVYLPNGKSETLWMDAKNNKYIDFLHDGRREKISINTIKLPDVDFNSPDYTRRNVANGTELLINDARYPKDALSKDIDGRVSATCIVEKDGSLSDIKIIEHLSPSIDEEAYRILAKTKLIPCKLGDKTYRCHHRIGLSFFIDRDNDNKKNNVGKVYLVNARTLLDGVAKRYNLGITRRQYSYRTSEGRTSTIPTGLRWHTSLEIDIPKDNQKLEQLLCQILFGKDGKNIEETGEKIAKTFEGKIKNKEFKKKEGRDLTITAHTLGYKKDKYYSYAYSIELDNNKTSHNFIYDIKESRILSAADVFTSSCLDELNNKMGGSDLNTLDIGIDDFFLYVGKDAESVTKISLSQDNWNKFTTIMQNILGDKEKLPTSLNENDFEYSEIRNRIKEIHNFANGTKKTIFKDETKIKKEGIQPIGIHKKIIRKPCAGDKERLIREYLQELWRNNVIMPDSDGFVANISFVLNKNQAISNFQTTLIKGDNIFFQKLVNLINNSTFKSMLLAIDGPANSYFNYDVEYGGKVYVHVDEMPEYPGGYRSLYQWIGNEIIIPDKIPANTLNEIKRIHASCIIEEDGSVSNAKVESAINNVLKEEIERVLARMPKWIPGKRFGKEVRVKTTFPLKLSLVKD